MPAEHTRHVRPWLPARSRIWSSRQPSRPPCLAAPRSGELLQPSSELFRRPARCSQGPAGASPEDAVRRPLKDLQASNLDLSALPPLVVPRQTAQVSGGTAYIWERCV